MSLQSQAWGEEQGNTDCNERMESHYNEWKLRILINLSAFTTNEHPLKGIAYFTCKMLRHRPLIKDAPVAPVNCLYVTSVMSSDPL